MKNKKWIEEDVNFLIENYPKFGNEYCSKSLNRSKRGIEERRKILKLKVNESSKCDLRIKYTKDMIEEAVKNSRCHSDIARYFGLVPQAGNFNNFKRRIEQYGISIEHFLSPNELTKIRIKEKGKSGYYGSKPLNEILVENSNFDSSKLKQRLFKEGMKEKKCELCNQEENWMDKKLTFILDHENGIHSDNRFENLRIVCPNCNSTLETHCSKNRKKK